MSLIERHIAWAIAVMAIPAMLLFSAFISLISLNYHLPLFDTSGPIVAMAVYAISVNIAFHTMAPIAAAAIIATYARMAEDGVIVALSAARQSPWTILRPALIGAIAVAALGYGVSCLAAPHAAKLIHDVLYILRRDLNLGTLRENALNLVDDNGTYIYFEEQTADAVFHKVFIITGPHWARSAVGADAKDEVVVADQARLTGKEGQRRILLRDGAMLMYEHGANRVVEVVFDEAVWRPTWYTDIGVRGYSFFDEYDTPAFVAAAGKALGDARQTALWTKEALRRFLVPGLVLPYALLGLWLLSRAGWHASRDGALQRAALSAYAWVLGIHLSVVIAIETIGLLFA